MFSRIMFLISFLCVASLAVLVYDGYAGRGTVSEKGAAFQRFAGGLGLGAAVNPKWGFLSFDPRVDSVDETQLYPIPGGYSYSPDRGTAVVEIREAAWRPREEQGIEHPFKDPPAYTDKVRCDNCGMDRNRWARTRYEFATDKGRFYTCSLHCLVVLGMKLKSEPGNIQVADYLHPERMVPAETAFYLLGGSAPGTMTAKSKPALASRDEAGRLKTECGGRIADFKEALSEAKNEVRDQIGSHE